MENKVRGKRNTDRWEDDELWKMKEGDSDVTSLPPEGLEEERRHFKPDNCKNGFLLINYGLFRAFCWLPSVFVSMLVSSSLICK